MFFSPLRPTACQSVRMDFLAVLPGVHSIDTLTLTDTESGFSMNLRYVFVLFFLSFLLPSDPFFLKIDL
jgi:hypothetical protein